MRIIGGTHRGRTLKTIDGKNVRPTASRTREALFNILQHTLNEQGNIVMHQARFADICCGSGSIGLEALSRGVPHVDFYDNHAKSLACARENAALLSLLPQCCFMQHNAQNLPRANTPYDIIFADPPYYGTISNDIAFQLVEKNWMHSHTFFITEQHKTESEIHHEDFNLDKERCYGAAIIRFYTLK